MEAFIKTFQNQGISVNIPKNVHNIFQNVVRRLAKEVQSIIDERNIEVKSIVYDGESKLMITFTFMGPDNSPYQEKECELRISINDRFPFSEPFYWISVKHINFHDGTITYSLFKEQWNPSLMIKGRIEEIQQLLSRPNKDLIVDSELSTV